MSAVIELPTGYQCRISPLTKYDCGTKAAIAIEVITPTGRLRNALALDREPSEHQLQEARDKLIKWAMEQL